LERYVVQRDRLGVGEPKWEDNTIGLAAEVYNGSRKSVSRYAHTARIIWDKHWHGGNRSKQANLTDQERDRACKCHMCGEPDSQHHCFRRCQHSNVKAVRLETTRTLQDYEKDKQNNESGNHL
jgi:Fe-S-cluster-containing hydrogenase component 2